MSALKVEFGEDGVREFSTPDEIEQFVERERSAWPWLEPAMRTARDLGDAEQPIKEWGNQFDSGRRNWFGELRAYVTRVRDGREQMTPTNLGNLQNIANALYGRRRGRPVLSDSPRGRYIESLRKKAGDLVAYYALAFMAGYGVAPQSGDSLRAAFYVMRFNGDVTAEGDEVAFAKAFGDQAVRFEKQREVEKEAAGELQGRLQAVHDGYAGFFATARDNEATRIGAETLRFEQLLEESRKKIADLEDLYNKQLALKAPVEYWQQRKKEHDRLAVKSGQAAGWVAAIGVLVLFFVISLLGTNEAPLLRLKPSDLPAAGVGLVVVILILFVWLLRVTVRILLSHIHLSTDAGERAVMTQTYLSLLRNDGVAKDKDLSMVLQALFRPSSTGIVADDGMPTSWLEWVTKDRKGGS